MFIDFHEKTIFEYTTDIYQEDIPNISFKKTRYV